MWEMIFVYLKDTYSPPPPEFHLENSRDTNSLFL